MGSGKAELRTYPAQRADGTADFTTICKGMVDPLPVLLLAGEGTLLYKMSCGYPFV